MKTKVAIVRGKFLNRFELQFFEPLVKRYKLLSIGSLTCSHDSFTFPVKKLISPVDLPDFPYKMQTLNRLLIDAHYLFGLEEVIKGSDIAHCAETYYRYTIQCLNAKKRGLVKKVIVSVFENIPFNNEGIRGRKEFKSRVKEEADHFIALSTKAKQALLSEGFSQAKVSVIHPHIDTSVFHPKKNKKSPKEITILFVGRLEECKGVFDLLKIANILLKDFTLRFIIVGNGSQKNKLIDLERKLGIDRFFTHLSLSYEEMPKIYRSADIFIAPSKTTKHWQEQFSISLLEAKASGLPVISTKTGSIPENVGKAGYLVKEGDYKEMVKIIKRLIKNQKLKRKYGVLARQDALKRFTLTKGAKEIDKVYQKVLD